MDAIADIKLKHKAKILVVDDKPENLVAMDRVLSDFDVEIIKATSGNEALKKVINHEFALLLLDVQMPEMDGYELAEIIRSDADSHDLPIIFVSAIYTDKLNVFRGYEKGAFSFITKPFEPIELQNQVAFFIDKYYTQKAYQESRNRTIELYNSTPEMLLSIEMENFFITDCNKTMLRVTGYSQEELLGFSVLDLCEHETDKEKVLSAVANFKKEKKVSDLECNIKKRNGEVITVLWKSSAVKDAYQGYLRANTSWTNITEKRKMQQELKHSYHQLKLRNEELESFLYLTSHQLQEPTVEVMSFLETLKAEEGDKLAGNSKKYIDYSISAAKRMKAQITALLNYLTLSDEGVSGVVDVNEVVRQVYSEWEEKLGKVNAKVSIGLLPKVKGDFGLLKTVFSELFENALKFREQKRTLKIDLWSEEINEKAKIVFTDNGIGISEEQKEKVFGIFQQLHERNEYKGLGVGLAMVKRILELHSGSIAVESSKDEGTTFIIFLPSYSHS